MKLGFTQLLSFTLGLIGLVNALTITKDTFTSPLVSLQIGELNVNSGAYLAIYDSLAVGVAGSINIDGQLFVVSNSIATSFIQTLGDFINTGTVSFDARNGLLSSFQLAPGGNFQNLGFMWFGQKDVVSTPTTVTALLGSWENSGTMVFYSSALVLLSAVTLTALNSVENDGAICLINYFLPQSSAYTGIGCFNIGLNSDMTVLPSNPVLSFDNRLTIALSTPTSTFSAVSVSVNFLSNTVYKIRGFGNMNTISIDCGFTSINYDSLTGILTAYLVLWPLEIDFDIGTGYDSTKFVYGGLFIISNTIQYNGKVPAGGKIPGICSCPDFPLPPTKPSTSPTVTTTSYWTATTTGSTLITTGTDGTNTLVIEVPKSVTSTTTTWGNSFTSETTATGSTTNTVIVEVPSSTHTTTSYWTETTTGSTLITTGRWHQHSCDRGSKECHLYYHHLG
ncbi:hypothetical protein PUMCH_005171 [Australozyma saopauloensis]|uniref:Hyphally-regulated cell wall protein N-terminal domain-containing protein n=1 Tax=Australozyma saopauloensis TaxID=291208 RepID=A0AAX4HH51_9ASCO|nr:hypothetical protein PUMCH_005171 [[Candida] saopauloensis]